MPEGYRITKPYKTVFDQAAAAALGAAIVTNRGHTTPKEMAMSAITCAIALVKELEHLDKRQQTFGLPPLYE